MNGLNATLGDRVKIARINSKLSQIDLAKKTGLSQGTIAHIENGRNRDTKHLMDLAKALSVRAEWLYYGEGNVKDTWPFRRISQNEYLQLNEVLKEDIEDYVQLKLSKLKK
ncbi:helix-turn-helix domain-containing protein [Taylorella equigenitalis]|uniref:Phage repressor n=2 Tax=Taylorella equigenitalis TaxID=29575 RepID=A0A654KFB6_TAYEM|nr:helix-turn-helix transcriptional regulator [Taylorella equigenitalis]ADU91123.1 Putative phage repressor [Taylorella equigenitalis MCE9]AFN36227.1 putative repressor protein [Taylorella equigenitalis ATCC 35865]ASY39627.1 transcriptional regulator [Taylorella equigenitalis]ASY42565.1 transcriptional regulator [Taylorella equigenitalis]KGK34131.1 repressor [Taylorella equigenitalis]